MSLRALVVGGTSGIGHGIALALAERGIQVTVAGRSVSRGHEIVSSLPGSGHQFTQVDAFSLASLRDLADSQCKSPPDIVVMTQGMATMQGYTPTADGLDQKLCLHYYSRFYLAMLMAPKLKPDSRIVAVLSAGVHSKYKKFETDFELKESYSLKNAADAGGFYLDAGLEHVALKYPHLSICHMCPGFVNTNWGTELPAFLRKFVVRPMQAMLAKSSEKCGQLLTEGFMSLPNGYSLVDEHGKVIDKKKGLRHTAQERDIVIEKTLALLPDLQST